MRHPRQSATLPQSSSGVDRLGNDKAAGTVQLDPQRLVQARKRAGLSRERLAELARGRLAVSAVTIKRAEKGRPVHLDTARCLAELLSMPLDALLVSRDGDTILTANDSPASLYPPLAGRGMELDRTLAALARARAGRSAFVLLSGDPGIGKTRLIRELCLRALEQGTPCGVGTGQEHLGIPFAAVTDALNPLALQLSGVDHPDAPLIAEFLRCGRVPDASLRPEESRLALFRALSSALLRLAARTPLLLVLDDLHWVDQGSIELFEHLVRCAAEGEWRGVRCGILLVGCIRSDQRNSTIGQRMARLCRETIATRIDLGGLERSHMQELLVGLSVERPSQSLVNVVHDSTAGNPFFVQEVVRVLREAGELTRHGGLTVLGRPSSYIHLPESVTDALSTRCRALSEGCTRALTYGACLGTQFELSNLAKVMHQDPDDLVELLQDAVDEGLLDCRQQSFSFSHPLIRQVCRQLVSEALRQRIHFEIAEHLRRLDDAERDNRVHEIAHHLIESGPLAEAGQVLLYSSAAGTRAELALAWETATHFYDAALSSTHDAQRRAGLHLRNGWAYYNAYEIGRALEHYAAAEGAFERVGDVTGKIRALNEQTRLSMSAGMPLTLDALEGHLPRLVVDEPRLAAEVMSTLADCYVLRKDQQRALSLASSALDIALKTQDDALGARVCNSVAICHLRNLDLQSALTEWTRGYEFAMRCGEPIYASRYLQRMPLALGPLGRFNELESAAARAWEFHEQYPNLGEISFVLHARAWLALVRGHTAQAIHYAREAIATIDRSAYVLAAPLVMPTLACAYALRGQWDQAAASLDQLASVMRQDERSVGGAVGRYHTLIAVSRTNAPAVPSNDRSSAPSAGAPPVLDVARIGRLCAHIESVQLGGGDLSQDDVEQLKGAYERGVNFTNTWLYAVPRMLGVAEARAQRFTQSDEYFERSLELTDQLGARTEHARSCLDYAASLATRSRVDTRARELLGRARAAFVEMNMAPLALRAERLLGTLETGAPSLSAT